MNRPIVMSLLETCSWIGVPFDESYPCLVILCPIVLPGSRVISHDNERRTFILGSTSGGACGISPTIPCQES